MVSAIIPRRAPHATRGFTLIEVLAALCIFAVAIVGLIESVAVQTRAETLAEDSTRAVMLAQNVLEEVRAAGDYEPEARSGEFEGENTGFRWRYALEPARVDGLYRLRVAVDWSDGLARKEYATETLVADRGE